ncbi:MAG TPA: hypothetical protein VMN58_11505 [Acidimicrobiales bacterium]|nr:hypothetical protein [Acidimicrobiales bacterium]
MSAPDSGRRLSPVLVAAVGVTVGAAIAATGPDRARVLVGVAVALGVGLLVTVPVPWGGSVPIGFALAMAVPTTPLTLQEQGIVAVAALTIALAVTANRHDLAEVGRVGSRLALALLAAGAAVFAFDLVVPEATVLARAGAGILGLVAVDALVTRWVLVDGEHLELKSAAPVHLTLACAAALIAVATDQVGVAMAAVAGLPLLIARFSFLRYASATDTLGQTVQALGLVPELAGLSPLGHSERTACYADVVAGELGFDRATRQRIVTASRLHRLGAVPLDDSTGEAVPATDAADDHTTVAVQGASILRDVGFTSEVADLVESAKAGSLEGPAPSLEAAVVRVAVAFDMVVGDDPDLADRGLSLLTGVARDGATRRATAALFRLIADRPATVTDAIAAGDRFRQAASGLDLESLVAGGGDILPFTRRKSAL